jgi:hypothetical protein
MPGSSNTSFIPKRNPVTGDRRSSRRQVYVGTFVVQILFIASLLATAGVFVYEYRLKKVLDSEIVALNSAIGTFNEAEMQRIQAADLRLSQANTRLAYSASITSILQGIEVSVADSVQITELSIARINDQAFEVEAKIKTTSFDSVMFQRAVLDKSRTMAFAEIKDLVLQNVPPNNGAFATQLQSQSADEFAIGFQVLLAVDQSSIPHTIPSMRGGANISTFEALETETLDIPPGLEAAEDFVDQPEITNQEQI